MGASSFTSEAKIFVQRRVDGPVVVVAGSRVLDGSNPEHWYRDGLSVVAAPTGSLKLQLDEDGIVLLSGIALRDVDVRDTDPIDVTLSCSHGAITLGFPVFGLAPLGVIERWNESLARSLLLEGVRDGAVQLDYSSTEGIRNREIRFRAPLNVARSALKSVYYEPAADFYG